MARTQVLPEATIVGALSAQLSRPRMQPAMSAIRRLRPSAPRKYRSSTARRRAQVDRKRPFSNGRGSLSSSEPFHVDTSGIGRVFVLGFLALEELGLRQLDVARADVVGDRRRVDILL